MSLIITPLIILLALAGFDVWMRLWRWQSRIGIGRWNDRLVWQRALERKARKWVRRPPTVKISDNDRWILLDVVRGKYRNRTIQSWQDAGLLLGLDAGESRSYAARRIDRRTGDWKIKPCNVDAALSGYALKKNGALPRPAEYTLIELLSSHRCGPRGTIAYRKTLPHIRFVDTIGMTVPFLTLCGMDAEAQAQIDEYDRAALAGTPFPSHAFDTERNVPLGIHDWCRGTGWYILGLVESNADGRHDRRIAVLAAEMLKHRKKDGGFGAMFFDPRSTFESSGSALAGLLMLRAYAATGNPELIAEAFRIEKRLMSATRRSGALDGCQGDTKGIGYYSHTFSLMPFAQGMALRLSKELNRYAER